MFILVHYAFYSHIFCYNKVYLLLLLLLQLILESSFTFYWSRFVQVYFNLYSSNFEEAYFTSTQVQNKSSSVTSDYTIL